MNNAFCVYSIGVTPYPGIKVDHNFYSMIEGGFKMECPYYASDSVWVGKPGQHILSLKIKNKKILHDFLLFSVRKRVNVFV